jgi:hypothetical protein
MQSRGAAATAPVPIANSLTIIGFVSYFAPRLCAEMGSVLTPLTEGYEDRYRYRRGRLPRLPMLAAIGTWVARAGLREL